MRDILKYVFLGLLAVATVIHLYHSWKDETKNRNITKGFLLPFIIGYYLMATDSPSIVLVAALTASWIGDVLLMVKGHLWFSLGGISFAAGHVLFVFAYLEKIMFPVVKWYVVIPLALVYYVISFVIIIKLKPTTPKIMVVPMYVYLLTNSTMNLFAMMQIHSVHSVGSVVAYIGAVLFFISDCTLFLVRYYKKPEIIFKKHFTVMFTYVVGEFLIAQGMLMM